MREDTQTTLQKRFNKLPRELQHALARFDFDSASHHIAETNNLTEEEINKVENEALLALMRLTPEEQLVENIADQLNIAPEEALIIEEQVNNEIFSPIRDQVVKNSSKKTSAEQEQTTTGGSTKQQLREDQYREPVEESESSGEKQEKKRFLDHKLSQEEGEGETEKEKEETEDTDQPEAPTPPSDSSALNRLQEKEQRKQRKNEGDGSGPGRNYDDDPYKETIE